MWLSPHDRGSSVTTMWQLRCYKGKLSASGSCRLLPLFPSFLWFSSSLSDHPQSLSQGLARPLCFSNVGASKGFTLNPLPSLHTAPGWAYQLLVATTMDMRLDFQTALLTRFSLGLQGQLCQTKHVPQAPPSHVQNQSITLQLQSVFLLL